MERIADSGAAQSLGMAAQTLATGPILRHVRFRVPVDQLPQTFARGFPRTSSIPTGEVPRLTANAMPFAAIGSAGQGKEVWLAHSGQLCWD